MVKIEYLRYIKSKFNFIMVSILTLVGLLSYYISYVNKQMWISQRGSGAEDINYKALEEVINNYTGMQFLLDFLFESEFYQVFIILLIAGVGIFLSVIPFEQKESGYGNMILIRTNYKRYFTTLLISQALYITTLITAVMFILLIVGFIVGGINFSPVGEEGLSFFSKLSLALLHIILLIFYTVLLSSISLLSMIYFKNKYIIQISPLVAFMIIPVLLGSTLANISTTLGTIIYYFIPFTTLQIVRDIVTTDIGMQSILMSFTPFVILTIVFIYLYKINLDKFLSSYL